MITCIVHYIASYICLICSCKPRRSSGNIKLICSILY